MKKLQIIFVLIVIFFAALFVFLFFSEKSHGYVVINEEEISVEIADTFLEGQEGLMHRKELCNNCGMLFVFDNEDFHSFWMKNTLISLDIIFIDSELEIVDVLHAVPCQGSCELYVPEKKALYALEVNSGRFDESIIGEKIKIN